MVIDGMPKLLGRYQLQLLFKMMTFPIDPIYIGFYISILKKHCLGLPLPEWPRLAQTDQLSETKKDQP